MQGLCIGSLCIVAGTISKQEEHESGNFFVLYDQKWLSEMVTGSGDGPLFWMGNVLLNFSHQIKFWNKLCNFKNSFLTQLFTRVNGSQVNKVQE